MVGVGTVMTDDPELTCRIDGYKRVPMVRVVADSHLRTRLTAKLLAGAAATPSWFLCRNGAESERRDAMRGAGAEVIEVGAGEAGIDLAAGLQALGGRGITRLMVEGGAQIAAALLRADLIDRVVWFHAPGVMGGDGWPAAQAFGVPRAGRDAAVRAGARGECRRGRDDRVEAEGLMRAAFYERQGPAREVLQLGEIETPDPGPGEVRVRLRTSGVNPSDWKSRGGSRRMAFPLVIPHSDGAGEIDAVGEGVPGSRVGERVWIWNGQWRRPLGTAAQYIALPSAQAVAMPEGLGFAEGACLGIPALTAMQAVRLAAAGPDTTLLVSGGAGGVGHYAIQFAKARGARVLTTVSGDAKAAHARAAGADETINYRTEDVPARVKALTGGRGVDAMIDMELAANAKLIPGVLRPHGEVVVYGMNTPEVTIPAIWMMQNNITMRLLIVYELSARDRADGLAELEALLRGGRLIHAVGRHMPLDEIAAAHDAVEAGEVMGGVVLDIP